MEYKDDAKREVKGLWIPIEIWTDKNLSITEKALYAEIDSFTTNDKACFVSNKHIADFLGTTETNSSKILNSLIDKGYVVVEKFDGRRRYIRSVQTRKFDNPASKSEQHTKSFTNTKYNITLPDGSVRDVTINTHCRLIFEAIYLQKKGTEYYFEGKDAGAISRLIKKIQAKMPENERFENHAIAENFKIFIEAIFNSGRVEKWIIDNLSLSIINSKFNEIYSQLKNGTAKQPNPADIHRVFGSRNIDAGILEFLT